MPRTSPACGIVFGATPASTAPQTSDMPCRGSTRRDSSAGTSVITLPSAYTRSTVLCGRAVCPPGPLSRTVDLVAGGGDRPGAQTRPGRSASRGSQCSAKIRSTSLSTPPSMASSAPPGTDSSAGWKISRTRPGSRSWRRSASASAAPSTIAVCASWPQAWQTPGTVDAYGTVLDVGQRQRVDVRPQRDHPAAGADVAGHPGAARQHPRRQPGRGQPLDQQRGGLVLGVGQLRVGCAAGAARRPARSRAGQPAVQPRRPRAVSAPGSTILTSQGQPYPHLRTRQRASGAGRRPHHDRSGCAATISALPP